MRESAKCVCAAEGLTDWCCITGLARRRSRRRNACVHETVQKADLCVAELQIGFDALGQEGEDLAIDKVEDVDDDEDLPGVGAGRLARRAVLALR